MFLLLIILFLFVSVWAIVYRLFLGETLVQAVGKEQGYLLFILILIITFLYQ
jgi:hypothetical protein